MNSWGFLHYFALSMCSKLRLDDFGVSLGLLMYLCAFFSVCSTLPFQDKFSFFPSAGGSRRPGTTGMWFFFLLLADECDFVRLPQQNCGQKVWDAWNSWNSVLPIWPNTTSISALLISKSRTGRQMCKIPRKAWVGIHSQMQRPFFLPLVFKMKMNTSFCIPTAVKSYLFNRLSL